METMANKLADPPASYTVFEENQVLTHDQLNGITSYLDGQQRLSRVLLTGIGRFCGLSMSWQQSGLVLHQGCAITSDGDLIAQTKDQSFAHYQPFTDANANYHLFTDQGGLYTLYELVAKPTSKLAKPLANLATPKTYAVLLYLESYQWDPDICTGSGCDNRGRVQRNNLKVLLINKADLETILARQALPGPCYPGLADVAAHRIKISPATITNSNALFSKIKDSIAATVADLKKVLPASYTACAELLAAEYKGGDPTGGWLATLDNLASISGGGLQYVYDFLRNVCAAYMEYKESLFGNHPLCAPAISLFPKHIMLGSLVPLAGNADPHRHPFYPAPLYNHGCDRRQRAKFLHKRLDMLFTNFTVPSGTETIRITPSTSLQRPLSDQAIPYYYRKTPKYPINTLWSFDHVARNRSDALRSYHAATYSANPMVTSPLEYDLGYAAFFRIEGHLNWNVKQAETEIKKLIEENNLPISLIKLQVETDIHILPYIPKYGLGDLKSLHRLFRRDLKLKLDNLALFNNRIKSTVQEIDIEAHDPKTPEISFKLIAAKETATPKAGGTDTLSDTVAKMRTNISKPLAEFDHATFEADFQAASVNAASINRALKGITFATAYTPYEALTDNFTFRWMGWIGDLIKKRQDKAKELSLFGKFLEAHPGLEHLAGAWVGGTFVLVYSSLTKKVVADFALPYRYSEPMEAEEPDEALADDDTSTWNWNLFNDFKVYVGKAETLEGKVTALNDQMGQLAQQIDLQKNSVLSVAGSLQHSYTQAILQNANFIPELGLDGLIGLNFTDQNINLLAGMMRNAQQAATTMDKISDPTPEEQLARKNIDATMGYLVTQAAEYLADRGKDIAAGSEEERFVQEMTAANKAIADQEVIAKVATEVQGTAKRAAEANLANTSASLNMVWKR